MRQGMARHGAVLLAGLLVASGATAQVDTGQADFARYVALGDSLTAGVASAGLVETVQRNSFPALIHRQATGGQGEFAQPLVSEPGLPPLLRLESLKPLVITRRPGFGEPVNLLFPRPYDNLGVPGAKVRDTVATVTGDAAHDLVLRRLGTALEQALALRPTFVTVWIGNNDSLGAAVSGIVLDDVTLTRVESFQEDYRTLLTALAARGARVMVATLPNVTLIPFVNTIPPVVVNPLTSRPVLVNGQPVPLIGPDGPLGPDDRVLLTAGAELAAGTGIPVELGGTGKPLSDSVVLDAGEVARIEDRTREFNQVIRVLAQGLGAEMVDMAAIFEDVEDQGVSIGGITFTTDFLIGGLFSFDGVHPTPFGYAFVANEFLQAINDRFGARIPLVNLFPFMFGPEASAASLAGASAAQARLTPEAEESLWMTLNLPPRTTLERLARSPQDPGDPQDPDPPSAEPADRKPRSSGRHLHGGG